MNLLNDNMLHKRVINIEWECAPLIISVLKHFYIMAAMEFLFPAKICFVPYFVFFTYNFYLSAYFLFFNLSAPIIRGGGVYELYIPS